MKTARVLFGARVTNAVVLCLIGCSAAPVYECTDELEPSLAVDVVDAQSGLAAAAGAIVVVTGDTVRDSVTAPSTPDTLRTAAFWYENKVPGGTYALSVRKPGYADWSRTDVVIAANHCHVSQLVRVTASLQRLGL